MTDEQHIENLKKLKSFHNGSYGASINAAIKALEQQSDTVPKSVYIQVARERDIAIEQLNELGYEFGEKIELQKTGHWMRKTKVDGVYDIAGVKTWGVKCQCDKCDFTTTVIEDFGYYKYCPNCGTKMIDPQERSGAE